MADRQPESISLPAKGDCGVGAVEKWYDNLEMEISGGWFTPEELTALKDFSAKSGFAKARRQREFFRRHFVETLTAAAAFFVGDRPSPLILDLGSGTGSQAILFALHGARVVGVDLDGAALRLFRKRLDCYERLAGSPLAVTVVEANALAVDYSAYGPFDGVYSQFAFNVIQPSSRLVDAIVPHLAPAARWAVLDGNNRCVWSKLAPWRRRHAWSPGEMSAELQRRGFTIVSQSGGIALPRPAWTIMPYLWARSLDRRLCRSWFWAASHQTFAQKP